MAREALRTGYVRLQAFVKRDLARSLRLFFLISLVICSVGLTVQLARHADAGAVSVAVCVAVQLFVISLRVVELRRARPLPVWSDVVELGAVLALMGQLPEIFPMINTLFMALLFRAAIGSLPRLLLSQAGYLGTWVLAIQLFPNVEPVLGAMLSLPTTGLMVYGTKALMSKLQEQQKAQNALLEAVLTELPFPVVVTDAVGEVVLTNSAATELIGWSPTGPADLGGLQLQDLEERPVNLRDVVAECGAHGGRMKLEVRLVRPDGTTVQTVVQTVPMAKGLTRGGGVVLALLDVTAQRGYEEYLHKAAYFDLVTKLPNRRMLFERLDVVHGSRTPYALLLIDLNDFKVVNDTLGHKVGDEMLAGVGARIRSAVDDSATVARLGGDEFAILLPHAGPAEAETAARAVRDSFAEKLLLSCGPLQGKGTVGLAVAAPGETPDQVLERADAAMYLAKPAGRRRTRSPQSPRNNPPGLTSDT